MNTRKKNEKEYLYTYYINPLSTSVLNKAHFFSNLNNSRTRNDIEVWFSL